VRKRLCWQLKLHAFSYGLLWERDACDGERLQVQARKVWQQASRSRYRRWLG
jgi:hypothetical protein